MLESRFLLCKSGQENMETSSVVRSELVKNTNVTYREKTRDLIILDIMQAELIIFVILIP